jgi:hypothetical protein
VLHRADGEGGQLQPADVEDVCGKPRRGPRAESVGTAAGLRQRVGSDFSAAGEIGEKFRLLRRRAEEDDVPMPVCAPKVVAQAP